MQKPLPVVNSYGLYISNVQQGTNKYTAYFGDTTQSGNTYTPYFNNFTYWCNGRAHTVDTPIMDTVPLYVPSGTPYNEHKPGGYLNITVEIPENLEPMDETENSLTQNNETEKE